MCQPKEQIGDTYKSMLTLEIPDCCTANTKPVGCALRTVEHVLAVREAHPTNIFVLRRKPH
jgi:hypothetical protein